MTSLLLISFKIFLFYPHYWHTSTSYSLSPHLASHSFPCLRKGGTETGGLAQTCWGWLSSRAQPQSHLVFSLSVMTNSLRPHGLQQTSLSFTLSWSLLRFLSMELVMLSNHLILCRPLFLLPSVFPSIRVFSSELAVCIRWPEYWSFSICPSNVYSGLISFRIDWFHITTQGALKSVV